MYLCFCSPEPRAQGKIIGWKPRSSVHGLSSIFSKLFSETIGPISIKPSDKGVNVYIYGPGHKTKTAPTPIYGKNLKISFSSEPLGLLL